MPSYSLTLKMVNSAIDTHMFGNNIKYSKMFYAYLKRN